MTEKLLQYIWQFQYFNSSELQTTKGEKIEIIYPGKWNSNQGPDFTDGQIRIDKTLPLMAGIRTTKIYVTIWIIVLVASLIILQLYILQFGWWMAILYSILFVIAPMIFLMVKLFKADHSKDFAFLSRLSKIIMLTGILSMIFFRVYF